MVCAQSGIAPTAALCNPDMYPLSRPVDIEARTGYPKDEVVEQSGLSWEDRRDGGFVDCQVTPGACREEGMTTKLLLFDAMIAVRGVFKKYAVSLGWGRASFLTGIE